MGLLDSVLGGVLAGGGQHQAGGAGALINVVAGMLANSGQAGAMGGPAGGLGGLIEQFQRGGLGDVMSSWIGSGPNRPISPDQLGGVLGEDLLGQLTQQTGMNPADLLGQLSKMLPQMVDQATPEGRIPEAGLGDIGAILARFTQTN